MQNKIQVAVVDDDKIFQLITSKTLSTVIEVDRVQQFYNGEEALVYLQANAGLPDKLPDVILLDINMPVVDGWSFLTDYADIHDHLSKSITIYMVSSSIDPKDIERAGNTPLVREYIIKPIAKDKLVEVVRLRIAEGQRAE